jgi:hypothetical protein
MSAEPPFPPAGPSPPPAAALVRVEYLDFRSVDEQREFRFRSYGPEGWTELRVRISIAAFGPGRVRLQDGPDVCYQKLLRVVAEGGTASDVITIGDADLASYREAHVQVQKHASWAPSSPPEPADGPPKPARRRSSPLPVAAVPDGTAPLEEGQRVSHAVFGVGVTTSSRGGHTVVRFDQDGPKTFVTSMLQVDVLSAPHTWETGPGGKNRLTER